MTRWAQRGPIQGPNRGSSPVFHVAAPRRVTLYFQRFPGKGGSDADRGVGDLPYRVRVEGRETTGRTRADGGITLEIQPGQAALLTLLETEFEVRLARRPGPVDGRRGAHQRLIQLGYDRGAPRSERSASGDVALLHFQADHPPLDPDAGLDSNTQSRLRREAGA